MANPIERRVRFEMQGVLSAVVCFGLLSAIALPPLPIYGLDIYLVTLCAPLVALLVFATWSSAPVFQISALFPLALGIMVCVSALFSWHFQFSSVNARDIVEAIKYLQFVPYLLAVPFLSRRTDKFFHKALKFSGIVVAVVGFLQAFGMGGLVSSIYLGPDSAHLDSALSGHRITLTGSDPNVGGVIAAFFCAYYFSQYSVSRKVFSLFLFFVFMFLCFATQSRTALLALIFGLSVYYLFFFRVFVFYKVFFLAFGFFLVFFLVFFLDLSYVYLGFQDALAGRNNSVNVRFDNLSNAILRFKESPVIGVGPAKSSFSTVIDSEYALIVQRYGLLGVFLFFGYVFYLFRLSCSGVSGVWGSCLLMFTMMAFLVMLTNNIFSGYQLMSFVVFLHIACVLNQRFKGRGQAVQPA
ncbi:O-antigen ligase family protein [Marinobacter daepoensis]|uniref:O-antigen ligase family protein n=1 Tax=Marinobacter daepoensis TaxID=262077 RepID=UPI001C9734F5|nr:O-antigen ligase family protein [Marinobacter daepoensis]MBY6033630.1 O-antigen ligase family protein [Marinobacter daepoensis]